MRPFLRILPLFLLLSACTQNPASTPAAEVAAPTEAAAISTTTLTPDLGTPVPPKSAPVEETVVVTAKAVQSISGSVQIQSALSQYVLAVSGAQVVQTAADGSDAQKWLKVDQADGSFLLQILDGTRCLDANGGATQGEGTLVMVNPCDGSAGQRWSNTACDTSSDWACFTPGSVWLKSASGRVLDLPDDSKVDGEKIISLGFAHGGVNQQWYILGGE